ncbi:MAG TPA: AMP-binding protein, partial [Nitrososphaerales archaeon]|nr:AMP-binding protein [Nitrososphaerales archaeon]
MAEDRPWTKFQRQELERAKVPMTPPQPKPLYSLLTDTAAAHEGSIAMHYLGRDFTYSMTDHTSSRFATALASLGVKRGDRVAIFLPNIPQFVFAFFGILKAGGIVVNNNPLYKERELAHQLNDSGAEVIVASMDVVKGNDLYASLEGCRASTSLRHIICTSTTDYLPGFKRRLARLAGIRRVRRADTLDFVNLVRTSPSATEFADVDPVRDVAVL